MIEMNISKIIENLKNKFNQIKSGKKDLSIEEQIKNEQAVLKQLKQFLKLYSEKDFNFDSTDEDERQHLWKIIWNVMDSKNPSKFNNDKLNTSKLIYKILRTRSRYLGKLNSSTLFISEKGVITTIKSNSTDLIVIYPNINRIKDDIRNTELRIENLKRL